jgi:hypothetical protein
VAGAGVGSIGVGGMISLVGGILLAGAAVLPDTRAGFLLGGAAWLVPGLVLAAGGVGLLLPVRWGRTLSLAGASLGLAAMALVAVNRAAIAPSLARTFEVVRDDPNASKDVRDLLDVAKRQGGGDPVDSLRSPHGAEARDWILFAECCVPVGPWCLVLLVALGPSWGRRAVEAGVRGTAPREER